MNITLVGTKIVQDTKFLAFEKNNNVDVINITVDTDESWAYKLDVKYPYKCCSGEQLYNIINIIRTGNTCVAVLTKDMLPFTGKYIMQLRGISGDKVYHSDTFDCWVKYSIEPASTYDPVPSEFYQIESNITSMNNHPPKPGDNGYWMVWNVTKQEYEESDIPLPDEILPDIYESTKGKYLTNNGNEALWSDVEALPEMSSATKGQYLTNDGDTAGWANVDSLYTLPIASPTQLGGVKPVAKTDAMTRNVGVDGNGGLYTEPATWYVTVVQTSEDSYSASADKTPQEVFNAYQAGYAVYARFAFMGDDYPKMLPLVVAKADDNGIFLQFFKTVQLVPGEDPTFIYVFYIYTDWSFGTIQLIDTTHISDRNPLGITGAQVGQIAKITAVDADGKPTAWKAVTPEPWDFVMADGTTVTKKVYVDADE